MKKVLIVLPVMLLLVAGCQLNNPKTSLKTNVEKNPSPQASKNQTYTNAKYGYTLNYNQKWRIAEKYSKHIGLLQLGAIYNLKTGCLNPDADDLNAQMQNLQNCLAKSPYLSEMNNAINNYENNWRVETAETAIFTDLSQSDEDGFLSEVKAKTKIATDFPEGHQIGVFPYEAVLSFQKETTPDSKLKLINKYFYLSDGTKSYKIDMRGYSSGNLKISIPHNFTAPLSDGKTAKSLILEGNVAIGSDNETDFLNMAKSVKFEQ
jgi:hypothetical protein